MRIDILTLFPHLFSPYLNESILKRAQEKNVLSIAVHDIRSAAEDKHKTVDDTPFGGGTGMVLKVDVMDKAIESVIASEAKQPMARHALVNTRPYDDNRKKPLIILLTPQGERFNASIAQELATEDHLVLIAGHYEGFDERIREHLVDRQISIGDYVLTGGELPALVLVDAVSRFVPGVLPEGAPHEDSFSITKDEKPALEYPHYTRPAEYNGWKVPEVLLSGNHAEIAIWRKENSRPVE